MSKSIPVALKDELKKTGIWISGTTLHLKTSIDLPIPLLKKALHLRFAELEAENTTGQICLESAKTRKLTPRAGQQMQENTDKNREKKPKKARHLYTWRDICRHNATFVDTTRPNTSTLVNSRNLS